ncbi:MAG: glycosyltransferase family 39 protein [Candidatus Kapabacteria bacterium]|nr:glycosyltransferase family 39 protein [Candidatus Kapabacteria bacterium]
MSPVKARIAIVVVSALLFLPFLGSVRLFDWDEVNFAECAREMIETGDYLHVQVDFRPFYEKPPVFIWLQVLSMKAFGVNEFAARLPNAVIGIVTMLVLFSIGTRVHSQRFGFLWCIVYAGSLLPHFYFRSGIIDPLFNLFIFLGVWSVMGVVERRLFRNEWGSGLLAGIWAGLAVMTKGPVGFGIVMLTTGIAWLVLRKQMPLPWRKVIAATVSAVLIGSVWFVVDYIQNGPTFIMENLAYQVRLLTTGDAGHEQPWYYHSVVLLIGCYPASIFFFSGLRSQPDEENSHRVMRVWMTVLFFVVLVLFSLVKTKIVHYSSMTYLPMTYIAGVAIERWITNRATWRWFRTSALFSIAIPLSALAFLVPWAFMHREWLLRLPTFRDQYLRAAILRDVSWSGVEPYISVVLIVGLVAAWYLQRRTLRFQSIVVLFGSVMVFISLYLPFVLPRIEPYTQGAAVDFYESLHGKDVYVKPLTMKSYAHLFYSGKPQYLSSAARNMPADAWEPWLLDGEIDRPAYFVAKISDAAPWRAHSHLRVIREEGGFVFFERVRASTGPPAQPHTH